MSTATIDTTTAERIRRIVDRAPPLTTEQRARLAQILRPAPR